MDDPYCHLNCICGPFWGDKNVARRCPRLVISLLENLWFSYLGLPSGSITIHHPSNFMFHYILYTFEVYGIPILPDFLPPLKLVLIIINYGVTDADLYQGVTSSLTANHYMPSADQYNPPAMRVKHHSE